MTNRNSNIGPKNVSKNFNLAIGDVAILQAVQQFRFLRREHLSLLTGRDPKRVHRRLLKLVQNGLLSTTRLPQQKHIYSIGRAGRAVLVGEGIIVGDLPGLRLRVHELKELFLKHEMLIVDHHVLLVLAGKTSTLRLVDWREGRDIFDTVTITDSAGVRKLPVRPDAFFTIEDTLRDQERNRFHFFLEVDRSTMPHIRLREKLHAYWRYREQGLHANKFGIQSFRVLTVTLTEARARNLRNLAKTILPEGARKNFLFASADSYSFQEPSGVFGNICFSARDTDPRGAHPLVPQTEHALANRARA